MSWNDGTGAPVESRHPLWVARMRFALIAADAQRFVDDQHAGGLADAMRHQERNDSPAGGRACMWAYCVKLLRAARVCILFLESGVIAQFVDEHRVVEAHCLGGHRRTGGDRA